MRSKLYFSLGVMVSKAPGLLRVPHSDGKALPAGVNAITVEAVRQNRLAAHQWNLRPRLERIKHDIKKYR